MHFVCPGCSLWHMDAPHPCPECIWAGYINILLLYTPGVVAARLSARDEPWIRDDTIFDPQSLDEQMDTWTVPSRPRAQNAIIQGYSSLDSDISRTLSRLASKKTPPTQYTSFRDNEWTIDQTSRIREASRMGRDNDQDTINAHELHEHSVGRSSASKYPRKIAELSRVPEAAGGVRNAPFGELLGDVGVHKQVLHRLNEVKPYDSVSSSSGTPFSLRAHTITTSHTTAATSVSAQSRRKNYPPNRKPPSNSNGLPDSANIPSADARIPCNECPMTLANPRSLRSHMNTVHQERVRVRCNYEGCLVYYEEGERKAKSNIFEKHQKVKHAAWVEGLTVEQRCTVFVRQNPSPGSLDTRLWKRQSGNESRNEGRIPITDEQHVYIAS